MKRITAIAILAATTPALAHPGDHAGLDLAALAAHLFEPDHIIFATLAGIIGVLAYRAGVKKGRSTNAIILSLSKDAALRPGSMVRQAHHDAAGKTGHAKLGDDA